VADSIDGKLVPKWASTYLSGMLLDLLVLDFIFMILATNVKSFRNLVQLRGFFSGKIITLDVLKKERIQ